jgi:hypothetical protein
MGLKAVRSSKSVRLKHPKADALKNMFGTDACTALHYMN